MGGGSIDSQLRGSLPPKFREGVCKIITSVMLFVWNYFTKEITI